MLLTLVQPANQFETVLCPSKSRLALRRVVTTVSCGACLLLGSAHQVRMLKPQQCGQSTDLTTEWPKRPLSPASQPAGLATLVAPEPGRLYERSLFSEGAARGRPQEAKKMPPQGGAATDRS